MCPLFAQHQENKNTYITQKDVSLLKKKVCTGISQFSTLFPSCTCTAIFSIAIKFAFGLRISEFLFLLCVQKTVSRKFSSYV